MTGGRKDFNYFDPQPKNASLKKWLCIKIWWWSKLIDKIFPPRLWRCERRDFNHFDPQPKISREYFYTPSSILIAICKVYEQV
ncbi:MAG: hypothetical protein LBR79_04510 [Oscillospiraceae bacterium]|nr:hypothetical protein [Oscillospiraceae bacterium]